MSRVVSLGSINVDRLYRPTRESLAALETRHDWFPDRGQTVDVPEAVDDIPGPAVDGPAEIRHGGKGGNQAVAAARAGAAVAMVGAVGTDHERIGALESLREAGVDVAGVETVAGPTGTAHVFVDPGGDSRIAVRSGANGRVDAATVRARSETVRRADCVLVQNEVPAEPVADLLAALDSEPEAPPVVLDPAPTAGVDPLLATADYLTPNETEYESLRGRLDECDGVVVRTRGAGDVVVERGGTERFRVTPPAVEPVDTTGAGDVLNGVLAARLAAGVSLQSAVETAVAAGSLSTRAPGARGHVPTLETVQAFRGRRGNG